MDRGDQLVEITDHLVERDGDGRRLPVRRDELVDRLRVAGDRRAARLVAELPAPGGVLDEDAVDRLLVAVHLEIQRLSEEFRHGRRVWGLVRPLVASLRAAGVAPPYRVVDLGCGSGFVVRWLAAHVDDPDVELVGVDLEATLVDEARRLAEIEQLRCRFEVGDALDPQVAASIVVSTGVLHHLRGEALDRFFAAHDRPSLQGFVHLDFQPSPLAGAGAWLFHRTRARLAVSRHDGVVSARRSHDRVRLAEAVRAIEPAFEVRALPARVRATPFPCVLTTLVGARPGLWPAVRQGLPRTEAVV